MRSTEGADAFELDVRLSRDGAPVVMHDATLDRTTDRTGPVRAQTLADLRTADAGYRFTPDGGRTFPFRGTGVRIPTLDEVLWAFPRMPMLIEIKEPEVQAAVRRVLVAEGATGAVRRRLGASGGAPSSSWSRRSPAPPPVAEISALYRAVLLRRPPPRVSLPASVGAREVPASSRCRPRFVAAARSLGCPVHVWTVNETATARALWARGVAGIVPISNFRRYLFRYGFSTGNRTALPHSVHDPS